MSALVNNVCISSEHHVELGRARIEKDFQHLTVILNWLAQFNPFSIKDGRLISLSTGLDADKEDKINCDEAESW